MNYAYYPGCSLKGTGKAYDESLLAVCRVLGIGLKELDDWNCCGATAYMSVDSMKAASLAARNLALAEKTGGDLVAPCAACWLVLTKTQKRMREYPEIRGAVSESLAKAGLAYDDMVKVRHPLDILANDFGADRIKQAVKKPLAGIKVATYYGCQLVRPYADFDDQYDPRTMDRLLEAAGATVVEYSSKTKCCGASLTGTMVEEGTALVHAILRDARRHGADCIATACPLCQFNLDCFQGKVSRNYEKANMPVVYFTQLIGLALGIPARELGLGRGVVSLEPVLAQREYTHA